MAVLSAGITIMEMLLASWLNLIGKPIWLFDCKESHCKGLGFRLQPSVTDCLGQTNNLQGFTDIYIFVLEHKNMHKSSIKEKKVLLRRLNVRQGGNFRNNLFQWKVGINEINLGVQIHWSCFIPKEKLLKFWDT